MSFPGGIQYTNGGLLLSSKTLLGKQVVFTRLAIGDGELGGQSPVERTSLINEVESIEINKLVLLSGTEATVGGPFTNQGLATGFWWRELGIFAQDPDTLQERLYAYGNAGALADYIPAGGGAEILEKQVDTTILVSTSANISAIINSSLVYASAQDLLDHRNDGAAHGATVTADGGKLALRDAGGRLQVADPVADDDAVNKGSLESLVSAESVLDKLLDVDGAGSGLDADKVRGADGAAVCLFKSGTGTYTDNDTAQTFTDAFCTASSLVIVAVTAGTPAGIWTVDSGNGSFTITSTAAESADIAFDYYIQKAVG